ncbi:MAG: hypothetical protein FJ333_10475 [Sphingomonadales bacterium]|nr:hypothetical protein [Sphingomonadales bacterium]
MHNNEIDRVNLVWQCEFEDQIKTDLDLQIFLDHHYIEHPLQRICPRSLMRAAFIDSYALKWSKHDFPNEQFFAIDINGLYSEISIKKPFMTGKYKIVIGKDLSLISLVNNLFFYNEKRIMGCALVTILPPTKLLYPFLPYRKVDGTSVNTLCRQCAENCPRSKICKHSRDQRSLTAVYMLSEIEYSLSLGYELIHLFEIHAYSEFQPILQPFVTHLNFHKTKNSDLFSKSMSEIQKNAYCEELSKEMNLEVPNVLSLSNVKNNKAKRNFYKLAANSFFGKFSQRMGSESISFVCSQAELEEKVKKDCVNDIFCVSDNLCMVTSSKNVLQLPPSLKYNVYIGSQITAYARQRIHEHVMTLAKLPSCTIYHVNCDSLYFSVPLNTSIPFTINHSVGNFKHVYSGDILMYMSLGPRQYCVSYKNSNNINVDSHISGLSLKQFELNYMEIFDFFLHRYQQKLLEAITLYPIKSKRNIKSFTVEYYSQKFTLTNHISNRRYVCMLDRLNTLPYGFQS